MPMYNSSKYLKMSIDSILNQTFEDFELIIIDDCSKDNSISIVESYKDKRIKLIQNESNLGTVKTRNIGLKEAKGIYIAILDSDDVALPKRLEKQYNYLEKNSHIFLVGSSAIYIDEEGKESRKFRKYDDYKMLAFRLPKSCSIVHSSIMFRNTQRYFYDEKFISAHDYNFYLDLLTKGENLTNLPEFLVKYRIHKDATHSKNSRQIMYRDLTKHLHRDLNYRFTLLEKIGFSFKLVIHYLKTFREKRGKWKIK